jgi:hypothetical protein
VPPPDAAARDAGPDALAWSEEHVRKGMEAAEFFEEHQRRIEAEDAQNQLIATGVGAVIAVVILLVIKLRKSP